MTPPLDPRLHFVVATAIIVQDSRLAAEGKGRYLIAKRAAREKAFPNKWTVPGGKLVAHEYRALPKSVSAYDGWYGLMDWLVRKEVREEVGLEIHPPRYVTDVVFIRPDGFPVVTLSFWAPYKSGEVRLSEALTDHAWVTLDETAAYDLIEGIGDEIRMVDEMLRNADDH